MRRSCGRSAIVIVAVLVTPITCRGWAGDDARRQAKELFDQGYAAEQQMDYVKAIAIYRKAQAMFPETSQLNYRIGVCLQQAGHQNEAVNALKVFLKSSPDGIESADATKRLDGILLPRLTAEQRSRLDLAEDKQRAAGRVECNRR